jgi:hypothetical protein
MDVKTHKQHTYNILVTLGVPAQPAAQITNQIFEWHLHSGPEWTVAKLKNLKVAYIRHLSGMNPVFERDSWWKHTLLEPKGPWKYIFRLHNPQSALTCLLCYTQFKSKDATSKQLDKFVSAVTAREERTLVSFTKFRPSRGRYLPISFFAKREVRIPAWTWSSTLREYELKSVPNDINYAKQSYSHKYLDDLECLGTEVEWMREQSILEGTAPGFSFDPDVVGKIGFIQEPGFKLRAVASPFPSIQQALSLLGTSLYNTLKTIPEDCTFDQDSGVNDIQNQIKDGNTLMSIDLSSATDSFPLSVTMAVLNAMYSDKGKSYNEQLRLFKRVSRGSWVLPKSSKWKESYDDCIEQIDNGQFFIRWTNGQPLGLYPSFAAFAISHHSVVQYLLPKFYRILGDDIVIDEETGLKLLDVYATLGMKISWDKTITSSDFAEFGGRLISSTRIFTQPKWREMSDRSFVDFAKNVGAKVAMKLAKPRQRRILNILSKIPVGEHPMGIGLPDGRPYEQRLAEAKPYLDALNNDDISTKVVGDNHVEQLKDIRTILEYNTRYHTFRDPLPNSKISDSLHSQFYVIPDPDLPLTKRLIDLIWKVRLVIKTRVSKSQLKYQMRNGTKVITKSYHDISVLSRLGIHSFDIPEDNEVPEGLELMSYDTYSDPRGETTLKRLERLFRVRNKVG